MEITNHQLHVFSRRMWLLGHPIIGRICPASEVVILLCMPTLWSTQFHDCSVRDIPTILTWGLSTECPVRFPG